MFVGGAGIRHHRTLHMFRFFGRRKRSEQTNELTPAYKYVITQPQHRRCLENPPRHHVISG